MIEARFVDAFRKASMPRRWTQSVPAKFAEPTIPSRRNGRLVVFFLSPQWRQLRNSAWRLLRWWPRIEEQAGLVAPPAAFELLQDYRAGRLRVLRG